MKKLLLIAALVAAGTVQAEPPHVITLTSNNGKSTFRLYPTTLSVRANPRGYPQVSMVVDSAGSDRVFTRDRVAVAGCQLGTGQMSLANETGMGRPDADVWEWIGGGPKMMDSIAGEICSAFEQMQAPLADPQPQRPAVRRSRVVL